MQRISLEDTIHNAIVILVKMAFHNKNKPFSSALSMRDVTPSLGKVDRSCRGEAFDEAARRVVAFAGQAASVWDSWSNESHPLILVRGSFWKTMTT